MDDSADLYAGSGKNSHCTIVDVLPALVAVVRSIRAPWGGACGLGQSVQSEVRLDGLGYDFALLPTVLHAFVARVLA